MRHRLLTVEEIWRQYDADESRLTHALSERMLELAELKAGMRVLDLATGRGDPALLAAQRVGPTGHVLGIDSSQALLEMAQEKIAHAALSNLELRAIEAESFEHAEHDARFDVVTSRWGLMYMRSPAAALLNAKKAMKPGGVLVAALWAEPERVAYFTWPRRLLERYRTVPPIDFEAPGTFRYSDPNRIARDFNAAGFSIEHMEEMDVPAIEARSAEALIAWVRALGLTRLLADLSDDVQAQWEADIAREMETFRVGDRLQLGGVTRIVLARAREPEHQNQNKI